MKKQFRLTRSSDIKRVRRVGRSFAHPLIVLIVASNEDTISRIGITAGKWVGGAVVRNRAKRLLREVLRKLQPSIIQGVDIMVIARKPLANSTLFEIQKAVISLLRNANLITIEHDELSIPS